MPVVALNEKTLVIAWALYCNSRGTDPAQVDFFQDLDPMVQVKLIKSAFFYVLRKHYCPSCWNKTAKRVDVDGGIEMHCECGGKYAIDVSEKVASIA